MSSLNDIIYGKDETSNVVSLEVNDNQIEVFIEKDGQLYNKFLPNKFWLLSHIPLDNQFERLEGNLHYKYIRYFDKESEWFWARRRWRARDIYTIADAKENAMVLNGITYFKGMKIQDVSVLFFDIESTTLQHNSDSKVLLISNTLVKNGKIERKLFAYDEYESQGEFIDAWCKWVYEVDPSVLAGHNIFGYDLPYLHYCASISGTNLYLGRDSSPIKFNKYPSQFRKDGSQSYEYYRAFIYGREIIDTVFLSYHFDFSRKYSSYGLKTIIKEEDLEDKDRQFYDASKIRENYLDPIEWEKIKKYCSGDSDDAMKLYNLMMPAYFYWTASIPKSFQLVNYSASGSQLNSLLIRSYLQCGHSIPKATEVIQFEGALSNGFPGVYKNCWKTDISGLYPSIILTYNIYDKTKDPNGNFLKMVKFFTEERFKNKKLGKETGDRYYKEIEQAQKIGVNSAYGLLGATLNFNSPQNGALVTKHGREILMKAIKWATSKSYDEIIV